MPNNFINTFHQDSFIVSLSNFPSVNYSAESQVKEVDMRIFDYFVKNVVIPDMSQETVQVDFMGGVRYQPITRANNENPQLTIEFKAEENLRNYHMLFSYIKKMRYGDVPVKNQYQNTIKSIFIDTLDNQGRKLGRLEFTEALPVSLGSLSLTVGDSSELSFPVSFVYEEFKLTLYDTEGNIINEN